MRLEIFTMVTVEDKKPWSFVPDQVNDKMD